MLPAVNMAHVSIAHMHLPTVTMLLPMSQFHTHPGFPTFMLSDLQAHELAAVFCALAFLLAKVPHPRIFFFLSPSELSHLHSY